MGSTVATVAVGDKRAREEEDVLEEEVLLCGCRVGACDFRFDVVADVDVVDPRTAFSTRRGYGNKSAR
jgi:hypothetical protein